MSAINLAQTKGSQFADKKLGFGKAMGSEFLKFRTLTTNWVMTLIISLVMIGLAALNGLLTNSLYHQSVSNLESKSAPTDAARSAALEGMGSSPIFSAGSTGIDLANMLIASVAVVFIASEYATRSIGTTMTAVPKRSMIFFSKLLVMSIYSFILGFALSLIGFFVSYALLDSALRNHFSLEAGVFLNCVGVGLYFMMLSWMGLGFGALLRNNAGGIMLVVVCFLILPIIVGLFTMGFDWAKEFFYYLPSGLGRQMLVYKLGKEAKFNNLEAGGLLALWCIVPAILGYLRIRFTDPK